MLVQFGLIPAASHRPTKRLHSMVVFNPLHESNTPQTIQVVFSICDTRFLWSLSEHLMWVLVFQFELASRPAFWGPERVRETGDAEIF